MTATADDLIALLERLAILTTRFLTTPIEPPSRAPQTSNQGQASFQSRTPIEDRHRSLIEDRHHSVQLVAEKRWRFAEALLFGFIVSV